MSCGRLAVLAAALLVSLATPARGDVVTDWFDRSAASGYKAGVVPPAHSRNMALVAVAMAADGLGAMGGGDG